MHIAELGAHQRESVCMLTNIPRMLLFSKGPYLGAVNSGAGGDALGIESVHVLAGGKHIRVPDGVTARARENELAIKGLDKSSELVVSNNLCNTCLSDVGNRLLVLRHSFFAE
jgi:hypothetical protein